METPPETNNPQSGCVSGWTAKEPSVRVSVPGSQWAVNPMSYLEGWSEPPNTLTFSSPEGKSLKGG